MNYKRLIEKRKALIHSIEFHSAKSAEITNETSVHTVTKRLELLEKIYDDYKNYHEQIEMHAEFKEDDVSANPHDNLIEICLNTIGNLNEFISARSESAINTSALSSVSFEAPRVGFKLNSPPMPKFSGNYQEWISFIDLFKANIDQNPHLTCAQKLQFLKSHLTGEALSVIRQMQITNVNYPIALKLLHDRYYNIRSIVNAHLDTLMNQPKILSSSPSSIRNLIDATNECLQTIDSLNTPTDEWGPLIVFIIQTKMDSDTIKDWEHHLKGSTRVPKYSELASFLETRYRILDTSQQAKTSRIGNPTNPKPSTSKAFATKQTDVCPACSESHWLFYCPMFKGWTIEERKKFVQERNQCENCFNNAHSTDTCPSKYRCKACNKKHNTLLHAGTTCCADGSECDEVNDVTDDVTSQHNGLIAASTQVKQILLATAVITIKAKNGAKYTAKALIDQGSQGTFISERLSQILCLSKQRENIPINGLAESDVGHVTNSVTVEIGSKIDSTFNYITKAMILPSIAHFKGISLHVMKHWLHLRDIQLADPNYQEAGTIDVLLGAEVYAIIIMNGLIKGQADEPIAQQTRLGWIISGPTTDNQPINALSVNTTSIDSQLQRFWQTEEIPEITTILTSEESHCESYYERTVQRQTDGRYIVRTPFNYDVTKSDFLGESKHKALIRLFQIEKRLAKDSNLREQYNAFMQEYLNLQHMTETSFQDNEGYFLPHHPVIREKSTTTKVRVVFDASATTSNGKSFNDRCINGPTLQPNLIEIFLRWRSHKYVINADIEKMYRQIQIHPDERKFQKVLWRFSENETVKTFTLNTVTYGTASAPYLAIKTLFKLASDEEEKYPIAAERLKSEFYVDDLQSGASTIEEAITLQTQYTSLLNSGGFVLRKWASNCNDILQKIPEEHRETTVAREINNDSMIKTLGTIWKPNTDVLTFKIDLNDFSTTPATKRSILSDASKLFDPCGLLSPIIIKAKIILQQRSKWQVRKKNIETNDLVVMIDDNLPPGKWKMGRVTKTYPGKDGFTRVVDIKTKATTLTRPITKVCVLPIDKNP